MALPPGAALGLKVLILLGFLALVGWGIYEGYKKYQEECPDGLFVCLGIDDPEEEGGGAGAGTGPGAGPGAGTRTKTPSADQSPDFKECTRYFDEEDKTKTCYDPVAGKGGLRWFWSNTANGKKCLNKTKFYKIEASSAADDHTVSYEYLQPGGSSNGIIFKDATLMTLKNGQQMNMKFNITPLDKDKKALADPLIGQELNPGDSTSDCTAIGTTPKNFFDHFEMRTEPDKVEPAPAPENCQGTWSEWSKCTTTEANPICGYTMGNKLQTFTKTTDPKHGGSNCPTEPKEQPCIIQKSDNPNCKEATAEEAKTLPVCSYGTVTDGRDQCVSSCTPNPNNRDGGTYYIKRFITNVNFDKGVMDCNPDPSVVISEPKACPLRPLCPINCVGYWQDVPNTVRYEKRCFKAGALKKVDLYSKEQVFVVSQHANEVGQPCPVAAGTKRRVVSHGDGYVQNGCGMRNGQNCTVAVADQNRCPTTFSV